jgi:methylthioxylose transferase
VRPLLLAVLGVVAVAAAFRIGGFWWFDGLAATRARYAAGIASRRPYEAFLVSNLACVAIVTGPAVAAGITRLRDTRVWLLVGSALVAVLLADLSGMSKGEVERIWLPFAVWMLPAAGALARDGTNVVVTIRRWLLVQCVVALLLQTSVRTPW